MGQRVVRRKWLVRRIGRMYWQAVPYRVACVCRSALQEEGLFTVARVPALLVDQHFGARWCATGARAMPAASVLARADAVLAGNWSVYGAAVRFERGLPDLNADPVTGTRIPLDLGLSIDFRHVGDGIDIKHLWELNRLLWRVPLAQAWAASGDRRYIDRLGQLQGTWSRRQGCHQAANPHDYRRRGAKKARQAETGNGPQQPADVVARRAAQRMQRIAQRSLQQAPVHSVVSFGMADQRRNGLPALEQRPRVGAERLVLDAVDDLHTGVVGVHTPVAQVDDDLPEEIRGHHVPNFAVIASPTISFQEFHGHQKCNKPRLYTGCSGFAGSTMYACSRFAMGPKMQRKFSNDRSFRTYRGG